MAYFELSEDINIKTTGKQKQSVDPSKTYNLALALYPQGTQEIIASLRKGKSKHKNVDPSEISWSWWWGESVGEERPKKLVERIRFRIDRSEVHLVGKIGKWESTSVEPYFEGKGVDNWCILAKLPPRNIKTTTQLPRAIKREIIRLELENWKEEQRINNLSQEERELELVKALQALKQFSGFNMFSVK